MPITKWNTLLAVCALLLGVLVLGACEDIGPAESIEDPMADQVSQAPSEHSEEEPATDAADHDGDAAMPEDEHAEDAEHADDGHEEVAEGHEDMAAAHGIPPEAAARENLVAADAASVARGTELFQVNCVVCHGPSGMGDGPAAAGLDPKPAILSEAHIQDNTDGSLFYIISEGSAGTAMPPWKGTVSEEDRWHLVNFLRSLPDETDEAAMPEDEHADDDADAHAEDEENAGDGHEEGAEGHEDMATAHGIPPEAAARENLVAADAASVARGTELFQINCVVCHGPSGMGDGPAAAGLDPKPAILSEAHVQDNTDGSLFYVISDGSAGTAMPPWKGIVSEEDRWHLVNFIRSLPDGQ